EQPLHLPEPRDDRLLAVTKLVEEDPANPVSLAELGRQVGASERTLTRLFQQETGMTFRQWRAELRVHRALLLLAGGLSVYDAAAGCGWANPGSFITVFTSRVGMSPGRYQHSLRGRPDARAAGSRSLHQCRLAQRCPGQCRLAQVW